MIKQWLLALCISCYAWTLCATNIYNSLSSGIIINDIIEVNPTCGIDNGSLTIFAEGPPGSILQYSIDGGATFQTSNFFDNLDDQDYLVIVIDQNFCSSIPESPQLVNTGDVFIDLLEFECQTGAGNVVNIIPILSGSSETVYYTWEDENGFVSDAEELINVPAGTYYLHVENNVGCFDIAEITTDQCCAFDIDCSQIEDISFEFVQDIDAIDPAFLDNESLLDVDVFESLNGATGVPCFPLIINAFDEISGACGGIPFKGFRNYIITDGIDTLECQQEIFILDSLSACNGFAPDIVFDLDTLDCNKTNIDLNIANQSDHSSLAITLPSGELVTDENQVFNLPGDYAWTLTDTISGCAVEGIETIHSDFTEPSFSISGGNLTCLSPTTLLTIQSADELTNIIWTDPQGNLIETEALSVDSIGEYTATVIAANGCESTNSFNVMGDLEPINLVLNYTDTLNCDITSGTANIALDGIASSIIWQNESGEVLANNTSINYSEEGVYQVIVIDAAGCESTASFEVINDMHVPMAIVETEVLNCDITSTTPSFTSSDNITSIIWFDEDGNTLGDNPTFTKSGHYSVNYTASNGCQNTSYFEVLNDQQMPEVTLSEIASINCINNSVNVTVIDTDAENYTWYDPSGNELSTESLSTSEGGSFTLIAVAENGCTTELTIEIPIDTIAPSFIVNDGFIDCINTSATLSPSNIPGGVQFQWFDDNQNLISEEPIFISNQAGEFECVVTSVNGCSTSEIAHIDIDTIAPDFSTYQQTITCANTQGVVGINPSSESTHTAWYNSNGNLISTANEITAGAPNEYLVVLTDPSNGCKKQEILSIEEETNIPENIVFNLSKASCDSDIFQFEDFEIIGGLSPYTVLLDGIEIDPSIIELQGTDVQNVKIIDDNGCSIDTSLQLNAVGVLSTWLSEPNIDLHIDEEGQIDLFYNQADSLIESIVWDDPNDNLSCNDCKNPKVFDLAENVSIAVTVSNIYGCESTSEIYLRRTYAPRVMPPNVISPFADFTNSHFTLFTNDEIDQIVYLYIYDRYGELMFQAHEILPNEPGEGWDCTFKGLNVNPGVYAWVAQLRVIDGSYIKRKGDVTVIK